MCEIGKVKRILPAGETRFAWRAFRVLGDGRLGAIFGIDYTYPPRPNHKTVIPRVDNRLGFWSRKEATNVFRQGGFAMARVLLSGTIVEHSKGYRSSKMEILSLIAREGHGVDLAVAAAAREYLIPKPKKTV